MRLGIQRNLLLLVPFILGIIGVLVFHGATETTWLSPQLSHPLGTDEFARDILATLLIATGISFFKGIVICLVSLMIAVLVAEIISLKQHLWIGHIIKLIANIIEGVPLVLWILIGIISFPGPRLFVVVLIFSLVVLPVAINLLLGEFSRLRSSHYVESACLLGANEFRILYKHLLPNAKAILLPFSLQLLGLAIAVDGAIGVIGLGNRTDLDLGIFLLRGKENFFLAPQLLLVTVLIYFLIYLYLKWLEKTLKEINR